MSRDLLNLASICILTTAAAALCLERAIADETSSTSTSPAANAADFRRIQWTIESSEPVIAPGFQGGLDQQRAGCCSVHRIGDTYRMYYWATDADGHHSILAAETPTSDPNAWKPLGVVLERQPDKRHNNVGPSFAFVVPRTDAPWLMYVCTHGDGGYPECWSTYLAVSNDEGKSWQYEGDEPVLPHTRSWNRKATGSVCVLREDDKWRMYFTSFGEQGLDWVGIGYAESHDGIHWTYPVDRLVVEPRGDSATPREYLCSKPWVLKEEGGYRMWVSARGSAYRMRSLTSADGIHWNWESAGNYHDDGRLLGGVGAAGAFDDHKRSYPSVIRAGGEYLLWYTGNDYGMTGMGFASGRRDPN